MIHLNFIFLLILIGTCLRYLIYGEFDASSIVLASLFPITSVFMYIAASHLAKKEQAYIPKTHDNWSFYVLQKLLHKPKPLFKGKESIGVYKRFYVKGWHRVIDSLLEGKAPMYYSFFLTIGEHNYKVEWQRNKFFSNNDNWVIYKDGKYFGKAATVFHLKNAVQLKECIKATFDNTELVATSRTIKGEAVLQCDDKVVGTIKRSSLVSSAHILYMDEDLDIYILVLLLFRMYYK
ncbi:hypothetical protein CEQ21_20560 [Niallia circulans]|uniref:Tubby C-terminal domain-containing protein n=1 Tax=Niallia circulans TaxID=1397 RepID=A0A553SLF8_NIACI|nr:hypothetical protein [Niallia circulans]TRZ37823.1 hypothetical protein CEQ21_20560 [Niallia circulans]